MEEPREADTANDIITRALECMTFQGQSAKAQVNQEQDQGITRVISTDLSREASRLSSSSSSSLLATRSFPQFVNLPYEIRAAIWEQCIPRRIIEPWHDLGPGDNPFPRGYPVIAQVCREAHEVVSLHGAWIGATRFDRRKWYLDRSWRQRSPVWHNKKTDLVRLGMCITFGLLDFDHDDSRSSLFSASSSSFGAGGGNEIIAMARADPDVPLLVSANIISNLTRTRVVSPRGQRERPIARLIYEDFLRRREHVFIEVGSFTVTDRDAVSLDRLMRSGMFGLELQSQQQGGRAVAVSCQQPAGTQQYTENDDDDHHHHHHHHHHHQCRPAKITTTPRPPRPQPSRYYEAEPAIVDIKDTTTLFRYARAAVPDQDSLARLRDMDERFGSGQLDGEAAFDACWRVLRSVPCGGVASTITSPVDFLMVLVDVLCNAAGHEVDWEEDCPVLDEEGRLNEEHDLVRLMGLSLPRFTPVVSFEVDQRCFG
ncbi:hypothetical protein M406DRAFT_68431 [Cryphonectria parasitica EP155]|uniref:2EXR domain-containing protein n=1 Tax=Cryphonectria parasitica (strain ATCC 38755 / EP155) TaxID=660469 RepID=A0A9P4Y3K5_CRYP1|nr:uncharacterized protein M406DRAFT_68431 [Cryphonectria parasitica EP155]KAF3766048.1 hypothetical protein M406DRAFT_68431 [Cryphonectria parasitica EP155]